MSKKLSDDEIQALINRMLSGDMEARNKLILYNERLITLIIKGEGYYSSPAYDLDDLHQIGVIGLIKGIDTFDSTKGLKLSPYLTICIKNEIAMFFRITKKAPTTVSLSDPLPNSKSEDNKTMESVIPDDYDFISEIEDKDLMDLLINVVESLPEEERKIIKYYFGLGCPKKTQQEISAELGISQTHVCRKLKKIITKITTLLQSKNSEVARRENKRKYKEMNSKSLNMKHSVLIDEMYKIYGKPTIDWMGFEVTESNNITYHHIVEVRNGGKATIENGALLTKKAHKKLNQIQDSDPELYQEYQDWFRTINDMKCPPTPEIMEIMMYLKKRLITAIDVNRIVRSEAKSYYKRAMAINFPKSGLKPQKPLKI